MDKFPKYYKRKNIFPNKSTFKSFREKYPEYKNISDKMLNDIMMEYGKGFCDLVMNNREGASFPELLGAVFVGCMKTNKNVKSFSRFENDTNVKFSNMDTDGKLMKIFYSAQTSKIPFLHYKCWSFKMNKIPRRMISKKFKENWNKYIDTTNLKVNDFFVNRKNKLVQIKEKEYNEIDL